MTHRRFRPGARATLPACLALLACLTLTLAGCRDSPTVRPLNVVVVVLDTLRADHIGAYGYPRETTPTLDALAARGVLFENARAQAPCTFPSVNSLLTSRQTFAFLDQPAGDLGIPAEMPSLATLLQERGYATLAVSASPVVRASPSEVNRRGGFGSGYDRFHEACEWLEGSCVTEAGLELLDEALAADHDDGHRPPFLLYLHYMDPHDPYRPPNRERRRFAGRYRAEGEARKEWVIDGDPNPIAAMLYANGPPVEVADTDLDFLTDLYDAEIAYADRQLQAVLRGLERRRLLRTTLVVVVSDHGESFLEGGLDDGDIKHCRSLHDREVKVPLVFALPGMAEPRRVSTPVANLDVLPTVLDYVDQRLRPAGRETAIGEAASGAAATEPAAAQVFAGRSLRAWIEGGDDLESEGSGNPVARRPEPIRPTFSATSIWRSVADERFKLIHDLEADTWQLYDLAADPEEQVNVLLGPDRDRYRRDYHRLKAALESWMEATGSADAMATREAQRRLRSLGYLQ